MKTVLLYGLVLGLCLQGSGCASMHVIEKAQGTPPERDDAKPGYYLLLPMSVPLDIALVTVGGVFILWAIAEDHDVDVDSAVVSSGDSNDGLKVTRP